MTEIICVIVVCLGVSKTLEVFAKKLDSLIQKTNK